MYKQIVENKPLNVLAGLVERKDLFCFLVKIHWCSSTTIGFGFAGTCFSAISLRRTDRSERNLGTRGLSMWPNFSWYTLITKNQNFGVLPLARNVKHGAGSVQTKHLPRKGYGRQPWLRLRSAIHSSAPPTLPNRSAGLLRRGHIRRSGLFRHVAILNIRSKWQDPEILIFVKRVYHGELGHMLKSLVSKFRPDLSASLKDIVEK